MKTLLVSLVSEQTLPNMLFIRQFGHEASALCFLNTTRFQQEGRANWIRIAANVEQKLTYEAMLDPENMDNCLEALRKVDWEQFDKILINLTGGTKMMALAVYSYFTTTFPCTTSIYYIPVFQSQCLQIYPKNESIPLQSEINVREYLKSYGIQIVFESNLHLQEKPSQIADEIFQKVAVKNDKATVEKIQKWHEIIDSAERKLYQGDWLEVWLANQIHYILNIPKSNIMQGVRINKAGMPGTANNEFDVLFVHHNRLFAGECKFYNAGKFKMAGTTGSSREIYKLGNLRNNFGLHATPFIVTANDISNVREFIPACEFYGIRSIADKFIMRNQPDFENFIKNLK